MEATVGLCSLPVVPFVFLARNPRYADMNCENKWKRSQAAPGSKTAVSAADSCWYASLPDDSSYFSAYHARATRIYWWCINKVVFFLFHLILPLFCQIVWRLIPPPRSTSDPGPYTTQGPEFQTPVLNLLINSTEPQSKRQSGRDTRGLTRPITGWAP